MPDMSHEDQVREVQIVYLRTMVNELLDKRNNTKTSSRVMSLRLVTDALGRAMEVGLKPRNFTQQLKQSASLLLCRDDSDVPWPVDTAGVLNSPEVGLLRALRALTVLVEDGSHTNTDQEANRYDYLVQFSEENQEYVAVCTEFPSYSYLDPDEEVALKGIKDLVTKVFAKLEYQP